jgi:carbamate kinase
MMRPRIVIALGGNALLRRGEPAEAETQRRNVLEAASALAALAADHELVITHGNGPQVGLLSLETDAYKAVSPYPLDVLGAESQGMIRYLLVQALRNELPERQVVAVLTQVAVAADDPAFLEPTKPIGPVYSEREARELGRHQGWRIAPDGNYFIDKDLTAALLAEALGAERLVLATDVAFVELDWGTAASAPIERATPGTLRRTLFAAGSMGPKVEAACRFVERTGGVCAIGSLAEIAELVRGSAGTQIVPERIALATP